MNRTTWTEIAIENGENFIKQILIEVPKEEAEIIMRNKIEDFDEKLLLIKEYTIDKSEELQFFQDKTMKFKNFEIITSTQVSSSDKLINTSSKSHSWLDFYAI